MLDDFSVDDVGVAVVLLLVLDELSVDDVELLVVIVGVGAIVVLDATVRKLVVSTTGNGVLPMVDVVSCSFGQERRIVL